MFPTQYHEFEVCVVGGGMAGMCAAIASARRGAKTVLIQDRPVLGGNASSEVRMWICGAYGKGNEETGILEDIFLENLYRNPGGNYSIWDSVLYEKVAFQPNLTLLLNATCLDGEAEGPDDDRRLLAIRCWQLTTQTYHQIGAKVFIDCSGDSILAPISGAETRWGREARAEFGEDIEPEEADRKTMGNSLLIQLRNTDEPQPFVPPVWAYQFDAVEHLKTRVKGVQAHNFWWIELGGLQDTLVDAEVIRHELMKTAWGVWDYIKNRAPEKEKSANWALEWLGSLPGKRENRRYVGDHILTQNDIRAEGKFEDIVAYGGWSMDDHHPAGLLYPGEPTIFHPAPSPYGIPFRSLYSRNVRNLLCAGRNISTTHAALSSTRVMATCALLGQAVGTAAAFSVRDGVNPAFFSQGDKLDEFQAALMDDDVWLPGRSRPISPLTQAGELDVAPTLNNGHDRKIGDDTNLLSVPVGRPVTLNWSAPVNIGGVRVLFDSKLSQNRRMPYRYPVKNLRVTVPPTLAKTFRLEAQSVGGQWQTVIKESDNHQRLVRLPVHSQAAALRLVVEETWGGADEVGLFSFEATRHHTPWTPAVSKGGKWTDVVAAHNTSDLAPPDSGLEAAKGTALRSGA